MLYSAESLQPPHWPRQRLLTCWLVMVTHWRRSLLIRYSKASSSLTSHLDELQGLVVPLAIGTCCRVRRKEGYDLGVSGRYRHHPPNVQYTTSVGNHLWFMFILLWTFSYFSSPVNSVFLCLMCTKKTTSNLHSKAEDKLPILLHDWRVM